MISDSAQANVITDAPDYDPVRAYKILRSQPEDMVDRAFYRLTSNKVIAHKKDKGRATPGRNYEFTDSFHASLCAHVDEGVAFQAVKHAARLENDLADSKKIELDPFSVDGAVACIFDLLAHRRVFIRKNAIQ